MKPYKWMPTKGKWKAVCSICNFEGTAGTFLYAYLTANTHTRECKHNTDIRKENAKTKG